MRVIRAFVREPDETIRFDKANKELTDTSLLIGRYQAVLLPTVMLIANLSSVAVLWFGAHLVDTGDMQIGQISAFLAYVMQILMSVVMATMLAVVIPRAAVCADRITEVLDTEPTVPAPAQPLRPTSPYGVVEFGGAGFTYPGAETPVLSNVSMRCMPGTVTAIVGSTGSGKSTLVSLIPRLFDVTAGAVLVDGLDVRGWDQDELFANFGYVPQKAYLFAGTIASNIRYGNPTATDDDIWAALTIAQADDFVRELSDGLESPIAQGGGNLSGGQKQRLAIARAVVRRPRIFVFDDSFSALDMHTDAAGPTRTPDGFDSFDGHHRGSARRVHHRCRPDHGPRRRCAGRPRRPSVPSGQLSDVPRDRGFPDSRGDERMTSPQDPTWGGPNSQYFDDAPTVVFAKIPSEPESADGDAKSSNPETPDKEPKPALTATDTKPRHFKATMKRLLSLLQPHKFAVFCVVVATIASIALSVAVPKILGHATDLIFAGFIGKSLPAGLTREQAADAIRASGNSTFADLVANSTDVVPGVGLNFDAIGKVVMLAIGVYLLSSLLAWLEAFLLNIIVQKTIYNLRASVEAKLHRLPLPYFDKTPRGEILSRVTNDIDNISSTLSSTLTSLLTSVLTVLGVLTMMFVISPMLALIALIAVPVSVLLVARVAKRAQVLYKAQWTETGKINAQIEENYSGRDLVRVYGHQAEAEREFAEQNKKLLDASFGAQFLSSLIMPVMNFVGNITYVLLAVVGALKVASGNHVTR